MKEFDFDDIIKNKLTKSGGPALPESNWDLMEKKIFEQQSEIDDMAFEKLKDFNVPFDPKSWQPLSRRIEAEFNWLNIVFKFKLLELSFVLLLPFIWQPKLSEQILTPPSPVFSAEKSIPQTISQVQIPNVVSSESRIKLETLSIPPVLERIEYQLPENKVTLSLPEKIERLPVQSLATQEQIVSPVIETQPVIIEKTPSFFVNVKGISGAEINRITTPADPENKRLHFDRLEPGFSIGVLFEFGKDIWSLESGFIYSSKNYAPRSSITYSGNPFYGFFSKSMEDIHINMISIPVNIRKELLELDKWKIYGVAGLSINVAFETNYNLKFDLSDAYDPLLGQSPIAIINLTEGWLKGESLKDNGFVSVNLGMSFERAVTEKWSVFVQPTYQHTGLMLGKGIGPENDRIHTLTLNSGLKVNLFR
jgi:hypothetical protein